MGMQCDGFGFNKKHNMGMTNYVYADAAVID